MGQMVPEEAAAEAGPLLGMVGQVGGLMFGAQVGQALAKLAGEVLTSTDVGLPLGPAGVAALLPDNVAAFGQGLERPADEVRLFLALREAAYHRLFEHVPWLRQRLFDAVDAYARGISVDREAIERAMSEVDPQDPESMQRALQGGMFEPSVTPDAAGRAGPAGDLARAGRGLGRRRGRGGRGRPAARARRRCGRRCAGAGRPAGRPSRPSPPWSGWSCGRAGCGRPRRCGGRCASSAGRRAATSCGGTPTCCRRPTTWTTRRGSSGAAARPESSTRAQPASSARVASQPSRSGSRRRGPRGGAAGARTA